VIVFQLGTGRLPFDARGATQWLQAHQHTPAPSMRRFNPGIPEALDRVLLRALAKAPDERYRNAAAFAAAIREALPEALFDPMRPRPRCRCRSWCRPLRRGPPAWRTWAPVIGAVLLVAGLGAGAVG